MTDIVILTPNPDDPSFAGQWPQVRDRLVSALAAGGLTARSEAWTDHVDRAEGLAGADLVLPLVAWGYHRDHARWMKACTTWQAAGVRMLNPPSVLGWNSDKSYLERLGAAGVPIPATIWSEQITPDQVASAFDALGTDELVVKPRVSGGGWQTTRLARGEALTEAPDCPALIQPFIAALETEGELSLLFFGGRFSHAVRKRPRAGEFRIQQQFGGLYGAEADPHPVALALAERVLATVGEELLYARIDLARGAKGEWLLMEAELIEPDFYLNHAPDGGQAFVTAVAERLNR
ncbi:transporter [Brevundimonas sp.]|uniref:ATP-grasp domain-containing protein n=1 Tax=Brevundimonas sp. TaxID=1871086 RepID=UPI001D2EDD85|nr:transporter [Brevundimonas sp.]MBL0948026.1 transporter [Brevundimonas sp.]